MLSSIAIICKGDDMTWRVEVNEEVLGLFWPLVDKSRGEDACWIYTGQTNDRGYGVLYYQHLSMLAHRLSYTIHRGPIPAGRKVLHTCDTPPCIQPLHLWPGTHADNVHDMDRKGRRGKQPYHRGEKSPVAKLTDAQTTELRQRYLSGEVTQKQLAEEYGVIRQTISTWVSGKRAGTTSISRPPREYATRGEGHYEGKLTTDAVRIFRARAAAGHRLKDITDEYNATALAPVTKQMVWRIIHRKAWTHVE